MCKKQVMEHLQEAFGRKKDSCKIQTLKKKQAYLFFYHTFLFQANRPQLPKMWKKGKSGLLIKVQSLKFAGIWTLLVETKPALLDQEHKNSHESIFEPEPCIQLHPTIMAGFLSKQNNRF